MRDNEEFSYRLIGPDVDTLVRCFDRRYMNPVRSTQEMFEAFQSVWNLMARVAPLEKNEDVKALWIRVPKGKIEDFCSFDDAKEYYEVKSYQEYEELWAEEYPDDLCWYRVVAARTYDRNGELDYYAVSIGNNRVISASMRDVFLDPCPDYLKESACVLCNLILPALRESVDMLIAGTYNETVERELPYKFRTGVIKRSDFWEVVPGNKGVVYDGLGEEEVQRFIERIESGVNSEEKLAFMQTFTANDFFRACKLGYEAIGKECAPYSLPDMYMRYADGRDEGLTGKGHGLNAGDGIDFDSPIEWDSWYHTRKQRGGHPWEVVPGGNSTHMELFVRDYRSTVEINYKFDRITKEEYLAQKKTAGYYFEINGVHRVYESVRFYLALSDAGLPVIIDDAEEIVAMFTASDYIGIVPQHIIPRYCEDMFPREYGHVVDFMHVYADDSAWFDRITWLPETAAKLSMEEVSL